MIDVPDVGECSFKLCDVIGLEEGEGRKNTLKIEDLCDILDGKVKQGTKVCYAACILLVILFICIIAILQF